MQNFEYRAVVNFELDIMYDDFIPIIDSISCFSFLRSRLFNQLDSIILSDSIIYRNIHFESDVVRWWFHFYQWIPYHDLLFRSFSPPFLLLLKIRIRAVMHFESFSMWWWFHFYSQVFRPLANALSTWINQYLLKNLLTYAKLILKPQNFSHNFFQI